MQMEKLQQELHIMKITPATKALSNSLIIRKIVKDFDESSLLPLRAVSKSWETEISSLLLISNARTPENLRTEISENSLFVVIRAEGRTNKKALQDLVDLLHKGKRANRKFPCSRFVINSSHLIETPELKSFLTGFGSSIKSLGLNLNNSSYEQTPNSQSYEDAIIGLRYILFHSALSIKYLKLGNFPKSSGTTVRLLDPTTPDKALSLESLNLDKYSPGSTWTTSPWDSSSTTTGTKTIVEDILSCSPKLKVVVDSEFLFRRQLKESKRMDTIKTAALTIGFSRRGNQENSLEKLTFVAENCFNLESISVQYSFQKSTDRENARFPNGWRSQTTMLNNILENNKSSLNTISCSQLSFLPGIKIPCLDSLTHLILFVSYSRDFMAVTNLDESVFWTIFPKSLDLQKNFSSLVRISLTVSNNLRASENETSPLFNLPLLRTAKTLDQVQELKLECHGRRTQKIIKPLSILLPNLKTAEITVFPRPGLGARTDANSVPQLMLLFQAVWTHFSMLERLIIPTESFQCADELEEFHRVPFSTVLDSYITGLDVETVTQLKERVVGDPILVPDRKEKPSILNMNRLKVFRIGAHAIPVLSFVSAVHGFHMLNGLQTIVELDGDEERGDVLDDPFAMMSTTVQLRRK